MSQRETQKQNSDSVLRDNLKRKAVVMPIIFAIVVVVLCIILSSPMLNIFPSGNHKDSLTTTAPTQTTEYMLDELTQ